MLDAGTSRGQAVATLVAAINDYAPGGPYYNPDDTATVAAYNQFINRVEVSNYMADNVYITPDDWERSTSFSYDMVVTDDPATVFTAMVKVNGFTDEPVLPGPCGAFIAPNVWKEFDCYNLAAISKTTNDDPFNPSWRLIGGYWQWGRKGPDSTQWHDSNTPHFAQGPTGPGDSEANAGEISGWDQTDAPDGAWSDNYKTTNDPCPDGFQVPTRSQWEGVRINNTQSTVGTWIWNDTNYSSARFFGDKLLLPAAGNRIYWNGSSHGRGQFGGYWSSSQGMSEYAWLLDFDSSGAIAGYNERRSGRSVRCVKAATKTQLTYSNVFPPAHIQSQLAEEWITEVEKRTNGEIAINYFPADTLIKASQTYEGVVQGIADIGMTALEYSRGRFPVAAAIDQPMGYSSGVQATHIANGVLEKFNPEEFNDTELMFLHAHGPGLLHTRDKAVHTLDDLKSLKIRSTGTSERLIDALGASPVGIIAMGETYQMLQKGVVDGSVHPVETNKSWKIGEVVQYLTQNFSTAFTTTYGVFMNKKKWDSLTQEQQKTIREINAEFVLKHGQAWDESDEEGLEFFKEKGGEVITQSDAETKKWAEEAASVIDEYIQSVSEKGIDGKAIVDYIKTNL
jgi:TRAP-type transport system periplasmic protein